MTLYSSCRIKFAAVDGTDPSMVKADNNMVYLAVEFPSSPNYYVDYEKILDMNLHTSWVRVRGHHRRQREFHREEGRD